MRTTYDVAIRGDEVDVDGPDRTRPADQEAPVHRPGRRGGERQPARADARHGGQCRGRDGRRGRRRAAGAGARGDEDAAHRARAARRRGHRDRRTAGSTGGGRRRARRRDERSGGEPHDTRSPSPRSARSCASRSPSWPRSTAASTSPQQARSGGKTTDLWLEIGKNGYLGINIPEEYGGGGGGIGDIAAVCEELAAQGCPLLMMVVSPAICGTVIARYGTEEQKQRWLPGIADGTGDHGVRDHRARRRHQLPQHHHHRRKISRATATSGC